MKHNKSSKILIAGYKGMVGSAILQNLKEKGYNNFINVGSKEIDLRRQSDVEDLFKKTRPEYVFMAAAKVGGIVANNTYKANFIYDNIAIATNIIHSSYLYGVKKLLNLGSSCIYPKFATQPIKEEYLLSGELEPTNEPYAIAKIAAIKLCRYYNEQFGTNFISVMPTNLYGYNDNYNLETSHVLPALIRKSILAKAYYEDNYELIIKDFRKNHIGFGFDEQIVFDDFSTIELVLSKLGIQKDSMTIWGTGKVRREFLHTDDLSDVCIYLMENYSYHQIGEFINIGSGKDLTISELVEMIKEIVKYNGKIIFDPSKPDGTAQKLLDVTRINKLGWQYSISVDEGIQRVVNDYLSDY